VKIGNQNQINNSAIVTGNGATVTINPADPRRKLTGDQVTRLVALALTAGAQEIAFRHSEGSKDAQELSDQIFDALVTRGGWKPKRPKFMFSTHEAYGVWVLAQTSNPVPLAAEKLMQILNDKQVGLNAQILEVPDLNPGDVDLMVGLPGEPK
jgi:hypothetical protein